MIFAHQIALDLTPEQEAYCRRAAGTARFTYNWALDQWKQQYKNGERPAILILEKRFYSWGFDAIFMVLQSHKFVSVQYKFGHFGQNFRTSPSS